jgi:hypothetical protein
MNLKTDPERVPQRHGDTGIFVRAKNGEEWGSYDIAELDKASLLQWLQSRGGNNPLAENTVGILLDYGHLHE